MKYGWITINITDMWHKPKYNSERVNQLLFADFVKIVEEKNNFCQVEKLDGYTGWVDKRFIALCTMKTFKQFANTSKYIVSAKTVKLISKVSENINWIVFLPVKDRLTAWASCFFNRLVADKSLI